MLAVWRRISMWRRVRKDQVPDASALPLATPCSCPESPETLPRLARQGSSFLSLAEPLAQPTLLSRTLAVCLPPPTAK